MIRRIKFKKALAEYETETTALTDRRKAQMETHVDHQGDTFGLAGVHHGLSVSHGRSHGLLAHDMDFSGMAADLEHNGLVRCGLRHHIAKI